MNRRNFLKTTAAGAAAAPIVLGGVPAYARTSLEALAQMAPEDDRILVIIQLFGGNDGLNTVIPADDDTYYQIRPGIGVPKDKCWNEIGNIYLHPALALGSHGGLGRMLEQGNVAIVQGVGYPNPNLSHFRSTDIWLSGINSSDPNVRLDTGWIGRWLEQKYPDFPASLPEHPLAIQFGGAFSLTLLSSKGRMGIEVTDPSGQQGVGVQTDVLDAESAGTAYRAEYDFIADIAGRSNRYAQAVKDAYAAGRSQLKSNYSMSDLSKQMGAAAALIAGGLRSRVYVVSMGGFDTHVTQQYAGDVNGTHPMLLNRLSDAIAQFTNDMIRLGQADRVVGMTVSEFGRRPHENGSLGTDHGAASVQFIFGTQVNSGVYGILPDLANLNSNGDLLFQVDYREVYAEILTDWFGMTQGDMRTVLQKDDITPLDVLRAQPSSVGGGGASTAIAAITSVAPNPFSEGAQVEFMIDRSGPVQLTLTSISGASIATLVEGTLPAGRHTVRVPAGLPAGNYLLTLHTTSRRDVRGVQCVR